MPRARTFLAVELTAGTRAAAVELQRGLARASGASVNWVDPANLHVTLVFLGEVDARDLVAVCRAVQRAADQTPPFTVRTAGVGAFPTPRRPKVVYANVSDGAAELLALHEALEEPLVAAGLYRREERAFTPHLTLGRVKGEADGTAVAVALPAFAGWDGGATAVAEVVVFTSELRRGGPEYTAVSRAALGG